MNLRICILLGAWVAMWFAFHFGHPVGYLIVLVGFAASVAIAAEDLREEEHAETVLAAAAVDEHRELTPAALTQEPAFRTASRPGKRPGTRDFVRGSLSPTT